MKNAKGISMISLIITIIVIVILSSIAIVISESGLDMAENAQYQTEKKELREAIASRFAGYLRNSSTYPIEGVSVQSIFDETLSNSQKESQALNEIVSYIKGLGNDTVETDDIKNEISELIQTNINHIKYTRIIGSTEMLSLGLTNIKSDTDYVYVINYYSADIVGPIF